MTISRKKIEAQMARKALKVSKVEEQAKLGKGALSRIFRSRTCTPVTAGRIARVLGVDVTEIMEDEA